MRRGGHALHLGRYRLLANGRRTAKGWLLNHLVILLWDWVSRKYFAIFCLNLDRRDLSNHLRATRQLVHNLGCFVRHFLEFQVVLRNLRMPLANNCRRTSPDWPVFKANLFLADINRGPASLDEARNAGL